MTAPVSPMGPNGVVGVIAISRDDRWAHAYADQRSTLAESAFGRPGQSARDVDFFDGSGRRLTAAYDDDGRLTGLGTASAEADPEGVRRRLRAVLTFATGYLNERPPDVDAALHEAGLELDEALARVPQPSGDSLDEDLRQARSLFGPHPMDPDLQNRGSFLHNLIVHHGRP